ncbi:hypothetical protein [Neisseria perflava]|uniref:hypothetical protein n=1 Tax=Neisseria perflava TaxID=33053 RepID=UPI00209FF5B2|nr:hypothetical protein [Neisseria perflava]MCP1659521.1 hypothetical protein [Neisseria perflava]MCP1772528.1 hypothetical protein [Neisseria perflava]
MNANVKMTAAAVLAMVALSACSTFGGEKAKPASKPTAKTTAQAPAKQVPVEPQTMQVDSIDAKKEVAYKCGTQPLTVMYGIKGGEVVAAQAKYKDQLSPTMYRVIGINDYNGFWGNGNGWVTTKANAANVDKVDGNMLTQRATTTVNGKQEVVDEILFKECVLDKAATAKLNRAAKK